MSTPTDDQAQAGSSSAARTLKSRLRGSIAVNEAYFVLKNFRERLRHWLRRDSLTDVFAKDTDLAGKAEYALAVFNKYLSLGALAPASLKGMRVLEIGPGESLGVASLFAAHGAEVATADAFRVWRSGDADAATAALVMRRTGHDAADATAVLERIDARYGVPLEQASSAFPRESFDLIVSTAVLEHTRDVRVALGEADLLLRPGGCQIHYVGLDDHGVFTPGGLHELTFLGVSDRIWHLMTDDLAFPNRARLSVYREVLASLDYTTTWSVVGVLGVDQLPSELSIAELLAGPLPDETADALFSVPARSARFLKDAPLEDWLVQAFWATGRKPGVAPDSR